MSKSADFYIDAAMAAADAPAPAPAAPKIDPNAPVLTAGGEPPTVEPEPDAELDAAAAELEAEEAAAEEPPAEEKSKAEPPEKKPEPKPDAKEAKNPRLEKSYEDLARRESALRKEQEAHRADAAVLEQAKRLVAAAKGRDALALLKEADIPWSEAAQQVLEGSAKRKVQEESEDEEPAPSKRLSAIEQELATLKAQKAEAEFRGNLSAKIAEAPEKYKLVVKRKAEGDVMRFVEDFYRQTKRLPGETLDETMEIALEAVELRLRKERDSWRDLTDDDEVVTSSSSKTAVPAGATSKQAPKTLTNNTGSGPTSLKPGGTPKAKTDEDYIAAAIAAAGNP